MKHQAIHTILAACFAALFLVPALLRAEDYSLAAGESATISDGTTHTYGTISVAGNLAVSANSKVVATTEAVLTGGSVTVDGSGSVFGSYADDNGGKTITLNADANGVYPVLTAQNGRNFNTSANGKTCYNISGKELVVAASAAAAEHYADGMVTFLTLNGAGAGFNKIDNVSSLTGCVSVAGQSFLGRGNGYASGKGLFRDSTSPFLIEVASGATLRFDVGTQLGSFNDAGCEVNVKGEGNLVFLHRYNTAAAASLDPYKKMFIRRGAVLDVAGTITFNCSGNDATHFAWFVLDDSNVLGPSIGKVRTENVGYSGNNGALIEVPDGVAVTVHDVEVKRNGDGLVGDGTFRIDATAATRTFEANIPATYAHLTNNVTIAKVGMNEATLVITNLPTLKVEEGVVRLTRDCVIGKLVGESGTKVVADGCAVTLAESVTGAVALETANGGEFVKTGAGRMGIYNPGPLHGTIHVADGDLVFSMYGLTQKYFRWTFSKVAQSPNPLWINKLWLFDTDGGHAATGMSRVGDNTASLAAGKVCWTYGSDTNLAYDAEAKDYQKDWVLGSKVFSGDLVNNMNNFPMLAAPVIDPENESSWLGITMRLADDDKPVTGYNILAYEHGQTTPVTPVHAPVSWKVEASYDGEAWETIDTQSDFNVAGLTPWRWSQWVFYSNESGSTANNNGGPKEQFKFANYKSDGLAADAAKAVTLQVDAGATADLTAFTAAPQKIAGITVDFAEGGGTIRGGALAQGGTLAILNGEQGFAMGTPLPVVLSGVDASAIDSWSAVVDGAPVSCRVKLDANGHPVLLSFGTVVFFR